MSSVDVMVFRDRKSQAHGSRLNCVTLTINLQWKLGIRTHCGICSVLEGKGNLFLFTGSIETYFQNYVYTVSAIVL